MSKKRECDSYTLIELVVVVSIVGLFLAIVTPRLVDRLFEVRLEGTARQISSMISYLHNQAAVTKKRHRLYYDFANNAYWSEKEEDDAETGGTRFVELGGALGRMTALEEGVEFLDITTPREVKINTGACWTEFSPSGFAEKAVIHIRDKQERITTIVIKPFSGRTVVYEGEYE
ncbi:MAG: type II secretion system protein [Candidatus Omnitrophica bacterium]|nr:type II secretion system protein [Candidatus Omnitrophota bacterium]